MGYSADKRAANQPFSGPPPAAGATGSTASGEVRANRPPPQGIHATTPRFVLKMRASYDSCNNAVRDARVSSPRGLSGRSRDATDIVAGSDQRADVIVAGHIGRAGQGGAMARAINAGENQR